MWGGGVASRHLQEARDRNMTATGHRRRRLAGSVFPAIDCCA